MKNHLFILNTLLVSFSAIAMDQQLFQLVEKKDATREEVIDLLDRGASVHARASHDKTPLMVAATYSNQAVCEALIEGGAAVNATVQVWWATDLRYNGWTPLHFAAESTNHKVCALLLERGAELFDIYHLSDEEPFSLCIRDRKELFVQTLENLIKHAWAFPDAQNPNESSKILTTSFLCLLNKGVPKDIIYIILQKDQEFRDLICMVLMPNVRNNKPILPRFSETIADKVYITTLEKLKKSVPQENLELLEHEHGDNLYKNIYQRVESPPTIHPESRTFSDSFTRKYGNVIFGGGAFGILLFSYSFLSFSFSKPL